MGSDLVVLDLRSYRKPFPFHAGAAVASWRARKPSIESF
jgi:hypothetical protein